MADFLRDSPELFWTGLSEKLRPRESACQLKVGKQGIYFIQQDERVTSFQVVPWQQFLATIEKS